MPNADAPLAKHDVVEIVHPLSGETLVLDRLNATDYMQHHGWKLVRSHVVVEPVSEVTDE